MSYERTNWVNGETPINADNLNNMEAGILEAHENLDNLLMQRFNLANTSSDNYYKPWLEIQAQFPNMPVGVFLYGSISAGYQYFYEGHILNDKFASFVIHSYYTKYDYHVYLNNGTWSYEQRVITDDLAKYLPLTGGKLTGGLFTNHVVPNVNDTCYLGQSDLAYHRIYGNTFYVQKNKVTYGNMQVTTEGTTSNVGYSRLVLGNNIPTGTAGNATGFIWLYGKGTGGVQIHPHGAIPDGTVRQVYLPNENGTLALQSEVQALETRIAQLEAALLTLNQE